MCVENNGPFGQVVGSATGDDGMAGCAAGGAGSCAGGLGPGEGGTAFDPAKVAMPEGYTVNPELMSAIEKLTAAMWPGAPVIPTMATGASDSIYTNAAGMPSYGVSGIAIETNDVRAHGQDERLPIESFYRGVAFYYKLVKMLSGGA